MAKPYKLLREKMPRAARYESEVRAKRMLAEMALDEIRHAQEKTQQDLATLLNVNQAAISKLEGRIDMYVSTLRKYVEALGGQLEIIARFPDGTAVRISQFENAGPEESKKKISAAAAAR
ncbi:MAG TPA: XRE family transcriptional regulator [Candidatus Angelobacter sp.]